MFKLKSKLIIAVMVMFGITAFMSCEKENIPNSNFSDNTSTNVNTLKSLTQNNSLSEVKLPKKNFLINFKKNGTYSTNDKMFISSYPQIKDAFDNIAKKISENFYTGNTFFKISEDGVIISNNSFYNGKTIAEILYDEGHFSYFKNNLIVTFNSAGFVGVSNPEIFIQFPFLEDRFIQKGEEIKNNIPKNEIFTLEITNEGEIIVDNSDIYYSNGDGEYDEDCDYEGFKDCVGDWWFLPGLNVAVCGVGCIAVHYL